MVRVKVISPFRDKDTGKYYFPGDVIDVEEERAEELISRDLVKKPGTKKKGVKRPPENRMVEEAENR